MGTWSFLIASLVVFASLCSSVHAELEKKQTPIGISKTKPKEGNFVKTEQGYMVPYKAVVPELKIEIEMVPVPGGKFMFGSADNDPHGRNDESPQVEVQVPPFWMSKYETTWGAFKPYMDSNGFFQTAKYEKIRQVTDENRIDAVTAPTEIYEPQFRFYPDYDVRYPAITMTQYSAKQYTKWLSRITGAQYRLPFESEWEYACRANSRMHFHFGNDEDDLGKYAWYRDNSRGKPHFVGEKRPNSFGLYDMHGNVAEWVLDGYSPTGYQHLAGKNPSVIDSFVQPKTITGRIVRGGSWDDNADDLRSANRVAHDEDKWKEYDPDLPTSPWWLASEQCNQIGFRIVRPLEPMKVEQIRKLGIWDPTVKNLQDDVQTRIEEGRGTVGVVDSELPKLLDQHLRELEERRRLRREKRLQDQKKR